MTRGARRGRVRTDILVREVIIHSKRTRTRGAGTVLGLRLDFAWNIPRANSKPLVRAKSISKSRPLKYEPPPDDSQPRKNRERRISPSWTFPKFPEERIPEVRILQYRNFNVPALLLYRMLMRKSFVKLRFLILKIALLIYTLIATLHLQSRISPPSNFSHPFLISKAKVSPACNFIISLSYCFYFIREFLSRQLYLDYTESCFR